MYMSDVIGNFKGLCESNELKFERFVFFIGKTLDRLLQLIGPYDKFW